MLSSHKPADPKPPVRLESVALEPVRMSKEGTLKVQVSLFCFSSTQATAHTFHVPSCVRCRQLVFGFLSHLTVHVSCGFFFLYFGNNFFLPVCSQTCVLKVNIHCDGCEKKVRKILHKIDGKKESFFKPNCYFFCLYIVLSILDGLFRKRNVLIDLQVCTKAV